MKRQVCLSAFFLVLLIVGCKRDNAIDDVTPKDDHTVSTEELKSQLTGKAIDFFDMYYVRHNNPHLADESSSTTASGRTQGLKDEIVQIVYNDILEQNALSEFIPSVIAEIGYPIWDEATLLETNSTDTHVLLLPFAKITDDYISSVVHVQVVNNAVTLYTRLDKTLLDAVIQQTLPSVALTEEIPFYLVAYLNADLHIFGTVDSAYLSWMAEYVQTEFTDEENASSRCESVEITICYSEGCAFQETDEADTRCIVCYTITAASSCNGDIDTGNGDIGGTIPSGGSFPNSSSGGGSSSSNDNGVSKEVEQIMLECNDFLNATGDEGSPTELDFIEARFCTLITDLADLVYLSPQEIMWLYNDHINNEGNLFSHITQIRAYVTSDKFDASNAEHQAMFNTYIDLLVAEETELFLVHFANVYTLKHQYDLIPSYTELENIINVSECTNSGNFNGCAFDQLTDHVYQQFLDDGMDEEAIPVAIAYLLKKLAQMGIGAVTDFGIQLTMEYWMGDHSSWSAAWESFEPNWWQVTSSAFEAIITNKYAAIGTSAFSDGMNYLTTTPTDQITANGFGLALGMGAISGFIGNNAADYVGKIGVYMVKYGPQKPWNSLGELGIRTLFVKIKDFRELVIEKAWLNPGWVNRGFALEEVSAYGRYKNMQWMNQAGEQNGPLDFLDGLTGIQLKSKANANNWSAFKSSAKKGLDQLLRAIDTGQCTGGRLDIMMPKELSVNFKKYKDDLYRDLINNPNYPQYANLDIIVGSFIE